ncbi:hypothetical protein E2C01_069216 [Portunus trituberculatus]|uniref:Uncharacterized protein n=1 Tax=Portunus trituberculatus TaxID=210409 RepID=A0A5B7HQV6_PORTR|nr:hypothetical protein [Portunus trituberculatus]
MTRTTLSKRLTCHLQKGTIKNHYTAAHKTTATRKHVEESTTIIDHITNTKKKTNLTYHRSEPTTDNTKPPNHIHYTRPRSEPTNQVVPNHVHLLPDPLTGYISHTSKTFGTRQGLSTAHIHMLLDTHTFTQTQPHKNAIF